MISRHVTVAAVRHEQKSQVKRSSVRDKTKNERKIRQKPQQTERERESALGIFSMSRFNSAITGFLALLVIKPFKKLKYEF